MSESPRKAFDLSKKVPKSEHPFSPNHKPRPSRLGDPPVVKFSTYLPPDLYDEVRILAVTRKTPIHQLVTEALRLWIAFHADEGVV